MTLPTGLWMLDQAGLDPSQLEIRTAMEMIEIETNERVTMTVSAVRSIIPTVPDYRPPFTAQTKTRATLDTISRLIQADGGNSKLHDYIKAVIANEVYPTRRKRFEDAAHDGLKRFRNRLQWLSRTKPDLTTTLQFDQTKEVFVVRWLDKTVIIPFTYPSDDDLNEAIGTENGVGVFCNQEGLFVPVDDTLYLSGQKYLGKATLAIEQPWVIGECPMWDLFNADDPNTPVKLGKVLGEWIGKHSDQETGNAFAEFFVEWYVEEDRYETNANALIKSNEFLSILEFDDIDSVVANLEAAGCSWRFASLSYGNFFYPLDSNDSKYTTPEQDKFKADFGKYVAMSDQNSNKFDEGSRFDIFEVKPILVTDPENYDNKSLKYTVSLQPKGFNVRQFTAQPTYQHIDSSLVKLINDKLTKFLDNYRVKDELGE